MHSYISQVPAPLFAISTFSRVKMHSSQKKAPPRARLVEGEEDGEGAGAEANGCMEANLTTRAAERAEAREGFSTGAEPSRSKTREGLSA